ncbi:DUF4365 domain-containing protein [Streptomyces prunicolor]|uniref:DUF4365 domain-containing protein n=1 Tax=Streptomyces prunicolor TaxID=67348 RepID=UPI00224E0EC9|nr:DUF4365 domain-containing protein [Streptomyces prunicolor]MCX5233948.1 DUF4365 domain-containing protein [Streptomyces prunicolor]
MRVQKTQQVERAGVSWVEHLVTNDLGWLFREQETADVGVDAQLEVVDGVTAEATGRLLGVQIKSGDSYFKVSSDAGWWFVCDADHVSYWLGHSLPVVVMLYEPQTKRVYWQHVSDQTVVSTGKGVKIHVPRSQELTATSAEDLKPLARSQVEAPAVADWLTAGVEEPHRQVEFYEHLLSARLFAMFPECWIGNREWGPPLSVTVRMLRPRRPSPFGLMVEVALVMSNLQAEEYVAEIGAGRRFVPVVIVVMCPTRSDALVLTPSTFPDVFVTAWSPDGSNDAGLKSTMDEAFVWAMSGG